MERPRVATGGSLRKVFVEQNLLKITFLSHYAWLLNASNSAGESPTFTTNSFTYFTTPPTAPATFGVTLSNSNQARFTWAVLSNATSYILWGTNSTAETSLNVANLNSTSLATNLTLGDWWFSVYPTNNAGSGPGAVALRFVVK